MALNLERGYIQLNPRDSAQVTIVSDRSILGRMIFHTNLEPFRLAEVRKWEVHFGGSDEVPLTQGEEVLFQFEVKNGFVYIARFARVTNWNNARQELRRQLEEKRYRSGQRPGRQVSKRFGRDKFSRRRK